MERLKYVLMLLSLCFLAGCYEIHEEIVVRDDGSGTYVSKMDMNKLLEMLQNFGGEEALTRDGLDKPLDTTIVMKDIIANIKDSTVPKEVWKDAKMDIHLNAPAKIFNTNTSVSFSRLDDLRHLMASSGIVPGMNEAFRNIFARRDSTGAQKSADSSSQPDLARASRIFDVTVTDGLISKKINQEKYKALMQSVEVQQARQMTRQGMEMVYSTTIRLPRPAKKISNPLLQLSNDKKTVTAIFNLLDLFDRPDKFSYTIEF